MGALGSLRGRGIGRPAQTVAHLEHRVAAPMGKGAKRGPAQSLPSRGDQSAASGLSAGLGVALVDWARRKNAPRSAVVSGREIPCERARGGGSRRKASVRLSTPAKPQRMERARHGPDGLAHGSRRRRSPWAHGWRGRRCRRAAPDISRRPGRIDPGRPGRMRRAVAQRSSTPKTMNAARIAIGLTRVASLPSSSRPPRRSWRSPRRSRRRSACARAVATSR